MEILTAGTPVRPALDHGEVSPMRSRALSDTSDSRWKAPVSVSSTGSFTMDASGTFPRIPVLVPRTAPTPISVLAFAHDGTTTGLASDPTVIPSAVAAWAKAELAHIPSYEPDESEPTSGHCCEPIAFPINGEDEPTHLLCLLAEGHDGDHKPEPSTKRKPTPRPRVQKVVTS